MRFDAHFLVKVSFQQLSLRGPTLGPEKRCHEFTGGEKTYYRCNESTIGDMNYYRSPAVVIVRLVAVNYANENFHGPASSLHDKSIMYPCEHFKCRVGCPCRLCKAKLPYCTESKNNKTCGDCSDAARTTMTIWFFTVCSIYGANSATIYSNTFPTWLMSFVV